MKHLILLLTLLITQLSFAQHQHDPASVHGMLVFGKNKTYLSHLPMFHKPHDYQVVMKIELSQAAQEIYLKSLADDEVETVYTLVPEKFVLPELVKNPKDFKADLYKGHFERGGTLIAAKLVVKVSEILFFKKLMPMLQKPLESKYFLIGDSEEAFLLHEIFMKPDFDYVSAVSISGETKIQGHQKITLPDPNSKPLEVGKSFVLGELSITIEQKIYLEFDDLAL